MSVRAVVPVKDLRDTKSRLDSMLNSSIRARLTLRMMEHIVFTLKKAGVVDVCVVSPDETVLDAARRAGAAPLLQRSRGLNPALEEGRDWTISQKATALLVLPADLPFLGASDLQALLTEAEKGSSVVISPDEAHTGTNALLLRPPDALPFAFGPGSFEEHLRIARERGLAVRVCERSRLAFDLDTAEDLARFEASLGGRP